MGRWRSRFSGFNARSVVFWLLAALLASVAVWFAPAPQHAKAPADELVFFEIAEDAGALLDAGALTDGSPSDVAP